MKVEVKEFNIRNRSFYCNSCHKNIINSDNDKTGKVFTISGYVVGYDRKGEYLGPQEDVVFGICHKCLNRE